MTLITTATATAASLYFPLWLCDFAGYEVAKVRKVCKRRGEKEESSERKVGGGSVTFIRGGRMGLRNGSRERRRRPTMTREMGRKENSFTIAMSPSPPPTPWPPF